MARRLLTEHVEVRLLRVLDEAEALAASYEARLRAGVGLNMTPIPRVPDQIWWMGISSRAQPHAVSTFPS